MHTCSITTPILTLSPQNDIVRRVINMGHITLKEYSERNGKLLVTMRSYVARGLFKTAVKMGRDWFVDENEPVPQGDGRIKSGEYVNWRKKSTSN